MCDMAIVAVKQITIQEEKVTLLMESSMKGFNRDSFKKIG
jgi:hypothetical protein